MTRVRLAVGIALAVSACAHPSAIERPAPSSAAGVTSPAPGNGLGATTQLIVVTTVGWDTTGGLLRRYERDAPGERWRAVGGVVPVVVGRGGLAWDGAYRPDGAAPAKREGDGRAPAGVFAIDTAFGFAPAAQAAWIRMPYVPLTGASECVDDPASVHYNTVVERGVVPRVDWSSAERMRQVDQYRLGAIVGYNTPPRAGLGSCIFLHVWAGPGTSTSGCTAMAETDLRALLLWADGARRPVLVQLPDAEYARLRGAWRLP